MNTKNKTQFDFPPRWVRPPGPREKLHGFSRPFLYQLEKAGVIRTSRIRLDPKSKRSVFLIDENSVLAFIGAGEVHLTA